MKKRFIAAVIFTFLSIFFLLPSETQFKAIKLFTSKEQNPLINILQNQVLTPIQSLCIFQKSEPYAWQGKAVPKSSCFVSKSILDKKIAQGIPVWAKQQIEEDLKGYKNISLYEIDKTFKEHNTSINALVRFKIKNGKVIKMSGTPFRESYKKK